MFYGSYVLKYLRVLSFRLYYCSRNVSAEVSLHCNDRRLARQAPSVINEWLLLFLLAWCKRPMVDAGDKPRTEVVLGHTRYTTETMNYVPGFLSVQTLPYLGECTHKSGCNTSAKVILQVITNWCLLRSVHSSRMLGPENRPDLMSKLVGGHSPETPSILVYTIGHPSLHQIHCTTFMANIIWPCTIPSCPGNVSCVQPCTPPFKHVGQEGVPGALNGCPLLTAKMFV